MKKVLFTLLLGLFILTGCSFSNEDKEEDHSKSKSSSQKKKNDDTKKKNDQHSDSKSSKMIQKAMMNLLIKAMKTVLPANSNLLLTRLLRMQSKSIFTI